MTVEVHAGTVEVVSRVETVEAESKDYLIGVKTGIVSGSPYSGEYEIVPSATAQVLDTEGRILAHNITVAAVPENYGLITWDGSVLTVS